VKCTDFSREHLSGNLLLLVNSLRAYSFVYIAVRGLLEVILFTVYLCTSKFTYRALLCTREPSTLIEFTKSYNQVGFLKNLLFPHD
jgi:hypothetical protein